MKTTALATVLILQAITHNAEARKVSDIQATMTKLLGHKPQVVNVFEAQDKRLNRSQTTEQPWSGSYWPDITGGIATHWRDQSYFVTKYVRFGLRYDVAKQAFRNDFKKVKEDFRKFDTKDLQDKLSPAEKYDLLVGDTNFSFTQAILDETDFRADHRLTTKKKGMTETDSDEDEGFNNNRFLTDVQDTNGNNVAYEKFDNDTEYRYWREKGGTLAYWSGICDGWGPASLYLPRPSKPVTLTGALGHQITFYPDDIKALGSYLFAKTNTDYMSTMNYRFAGRKCDEKGKPETDDKGYVKDIRCNDLDAGVWHLALMNRIGVDKMGFIMDVDNNNKINNHPVSSYSFEYVNPVTGKPTALKSAIVPKESLKDNYLVRRHPEMKYLLGIKAKVNMLYYIWAEQGGKDRNKDWDSPNQDKFKDVEFEYDLELDVNGNILGGEWGNRKDDGKDKVKYADQPDFIWMADTTALPYSEMSNYASAGTKKDYNNPSPFGNTNWAWDGKGPMPQDWIAAAKADSYWFAPVVGKKVKNSTDKTEDVLPLEAKEKSTLKSAQPMSHLVYFLFDQARISR